MSNLPSDQLVQMETTCGSLLYELQIIWDEVGESDTDRDKMLLELEQECLEVYRRKVDLANRSRAQLRQAIADSEAELAAICSAMGERPVHIRQSDQNMGSLKEELKATVPQLEEMRKRKLDRLNQFLEVLEQIKKTSTEIYGPGDYNSSKIFVDETDLSTKKLEELHIQLQALQKEKSDRLKLVLDHLNTLNMLCLVLGMDFKHTVDEVHPSLDDSEGSKNINNDTIERLAAAIQKLREVKIERMQRLQDLATTMLELWNLMDTPVEEQQMFQNVTCNIAASEHEITEPGILSADFINYVETEVSRLEELKASKMKELVLKKRSELEEICRRMHMVAEPESAMEYAIEAIESGAMDPSCILGQIEAQIAKVKEEAFSRKEILEKVEKWLAACEEESWLEEYNRDDNRYNAGRGAHLTLKRAEKARSVVSKLPAMVEALASKTKAWERERGMEFTYDGIRLLSMLEEYSILRQEKEQEQRRQRDQKRLQGQLIAEQEALFGSKPSPSKTPSVKKLPRTSTGSANRRLSLGGAMLPKPDFHSTKHANGSTATAAASRPTKKGDRLLRNDSVNHHQHDDSFAALSAGRRGLDVAGLPVKKHSFDSLSAGETEVPTQLRKPFSPVTALPSKVNTTHFLDPNNLPNGTSLKVGSVNNTPLTTPSKPNATSFLEDLNNPYNGASLKAFPVENVPYSTPPKRTSVTDEENRTPKAMPIPTPSTPLTVSVPMQTAQTPAPAAVLLGTTVRQELEEIEYSFEERRAGFIVPKAHLASVHV
ncbi:65-kDa microtubule-associated protein 3-like isoform X2 [Magnolia sinica]|nr:65-kDa microtubule-associated protein 3-like isoform X2 [Magnolia sinica]XP_058086999.1 65-kDa microtubule-associated protein 3-like isoform X2 [Magnolia sinica]